MDSYELNIGTYIGYLKDDLPDGVGKLIFKEEDERLEYEGNWCAEIRSGDGKMTFKSGDVYEGCFQNNLPHGRGCFVYANGDIEEAIWEEGEKHGPSVYECAADGSREELEFVKGIPHGVSKVRNGDGSEEVRTYEQGIKDGEARLTLVNGDTLDFNYVKDLIEGKAIYKAEGLVDESMYQNGVKHGPSVETNGNGDREERVYVEGVLEGPALLKGSNGDTFRFNYKKGIKNGPFTYSWEDGSEEIGVFDEEGFQNGPSKMNWSNGSQREGVKKKGEWDGKVIYTHGKSTPMPGKRDLEIWDEGTMVRSQKYYGDEIVVEDWYDLDKLVDHEKNGACPMKSLHR